MPRTARLDIPGVLHHVMVRGIDRCDIFRDDQDRSQFLERLSSLLDKTGTVCFAWALLSNHFHLLLKPSAVSLSTLMRRLLTGHAVSFNHKYSRSGHLFQNRYKSIVCEEEAYLLELVRYIHLNPLRAGLVATLDELDRYPWSGHAVLMGNERLEGQQVEAILERFGKRVSRARQNYRQFIADGVAMGRRDNLVGGGLKRSQGVKGDVGQWESFDERILGSGSFVECLKEDATLRDRFRRVLTLPELTQRVCAALCLDPASVRVPGKSRAPSEARGIICYLAIREMGYKGMEVGRELCLGPTGVSIAARRGEKAVMAHPEMKRRILTDSIDK